MGRAPCCDKTKVKRGPWSPEEDNILKTYLLQHGTAGNWIALPAKAGLKRCGKSCRLRWLNYLRPDIKHGGFTEEEDNIICTLYNSIGSRWSVIASQLPGRTDNDIKNYWNTKLKKKLLLANQDKNIISSSHNLNISKVDSIATNLSSSPPTTLPCLIDMSNQYHQQNPNECLNPLPPPPVLLDSMEVSSSFSNNYEGSNQVSFGSIKDEEISLLDFGFDSSYFELLNGFGLQDI